MKPDAAAPARDKILFWLKTRGPQTASALASRLDVTPMAVRQHLYELEKEKLVTFQDRRARVGRPARHWAVTDAAAGRFPDSHAELIVGILDAAKSAFGADGIGRLVAERVRTQVADYKKRLPPADAPLEKRVAALASLRRDEGYMAEWSRERDGSFSLVENHCPICDAAKSCQNLCGGELDLFQALLGRSASIERTEHLMAGARRCAYKITPAR